MLQENQEYSLHIPRHFSWEEDEQPQLPAKAGQGPIEPDPHNTLREAQSVVAFLIQKSESRPDGNGAGTSWLQPERLAHHSPHFRVAPLGSLLPAGTIHTDGHGPSVPDYIVGESSGNFTEKSVFVKFPVCFCKPQKGDLCALNCSSSRCQRVPTIYNLGEG